MQRPQQFPNGVDPQNPPCPKCHFPQKPRCKCPGGAGASDKGDETENKKQLETSGNNKTSLPATETNQTSQRLFFPTLKPGKKLTLEQLLELLQISVDLKDGTFNIQANSNLNPEQNRLLFQLFEKIKTAFMVFIANKKNEGIAVLGNIESDNKSLKLNITNNPELRAQLLLDFLKQLIENKLLLSKHLAEDRNYKSPTPFNLKMTPKNFS